MQIADFKCSNCGNITEIIKENIMDDFPPSIKCSCCDSLNTYRIWCIGDIDAKGGGKQDKGYYLYSKYGKVKGTRVKK